MPKVTYETFSVGTFLALEDAKDDLVAFIVEATKDKLPPDSSDSVSVSIEAVKIRRIIAAAQDHLDARPIICAACRKPIKNLHGARRDMSHFHKKCQPVAIGA